MNKPKNTVIIDRIQKKGVSEADEETHAGNKMKKALIIFAAAVLAAGATSGCVPKEDKSNISLDPDFSTPSSIELDFIELNNTTIEGFGTVSDTPYIFISDVSIDGNNDDKKITADIKAIDGTTEDDAEHFAAALLRHLDDAAADQYTTFEMSSSEGFGNLYDTYSVDIKITNENDGSDIYTLNVTPDTEITLDPDIEAYEENWQNYGELLRQGIEDTPTRDRKSSESTADDAAQTEGQNSETEAAAGESEEASAAEETEEATAESTEAAEKTAAETTAEAESQEQ